MPSNLCSVPRAGGGGSRYRLLQRRACRQNVLGGSDPDLHRLPLHQLRHHSIGTDPNYHGTAPPAHRERQGAPLGRQLRIDRKRITVKVKPGKADYYCLPQTPQSSDPYAAGTVRVQFQVGGRGLAQKTKGGFGFAEPCRDQRVDTRAQRTAMGTAWLVVAEIGFRRRARELV